MEGAGSGCRNAPTCPGSNGTSPGTASNGSASTRAGHESGDDALMPVRTEAGPVAFTIDWPSISWLWNMEGYPSWPGYVDFHRLSMSGIRISRDRRRAVRPGGRGRARLGAGRPVHRRRGGPARSLPRPHRGDRPDGLRGRHRAARALVDRRAAVAEARPRPRAEDRGLNLVTLDEAAGARPARSPNSSLRPGARTRTSRPGTNRWSPTSPGAPAGSSSRSAGRSRTGLDRGLAERAARELLAVQSSDWAFLDNRKQAGDYPYSGPRCHAGQRIRGPTIGP